MCKTEIGRGFTEVCLCKYSSGRAGFLLGVNTLDLRCRQTEWGVEAVLLLVQLRLFSAELWQQSVLQSPPL